ncbi:uncharacterized protein K460DRAFT_413762 [Cucurbitaria berberidis CBS 394.84]|uniref:TFIIS N-terminal domain-containing protein n=1 Tax=Cucurbitaria berberidis CBS 394.84 TaxID=1168544 RepID=A0A9P4GKC8_9PLEO|nr:uncharacterized protein K460DRAFT_413762 [Cucurbitaria berberidis CBS 394.84]KAF1846946.1 hypothetical protein K460DRAFT_413762 [Cucurbitaria berberidis CBS 394.84]
MSGHTNSAMSEDNSNENPPGALQDDQENSDHVEKYNTSSIVQEYDDWGGPIDNTGTAYTEMGDREYINKVKQLLQGQIARATSQGKSTVLSELNELSDSIKLDSMESVMTTFLIYFARKLRSPEDDIQDHDIVMFLLDLFDDMLVNLGVLKMTKALSVMENALYHPAGGVRTKAAVVLEKWRDLINGQLASDEATEYSNGNVVTDNPDVSPYSEDSNLSKTAESHSPRPTKIVDINDFRDQICRALPRLDVIKAEPILPQLMLLLETAIFNPPEAVMFGFLHILRRAIELGRDITGSLPRGAVWILNVLDQMPINEEVLKATCILTALESVQNHSHADVQTSVNQLVNKWRMLMNCQEVGHETELSPVLRAFSLKFTDSIQSLTVKKIASIKTHPEPPTLRPRLLTDHTDFEDTTVDFRTIPGDAHTFSAAGARKPNKLNKKAAKGRSTADTSAELPRASAQNRYTEDPVASRGIQAKHTSATRSFTATRPLAKHPSTCQVPAAERSPPSDSTTFTLPIFVPEFPCCAEAIAAGPIAKSTRNALKSSHETSGFDGFLVYVQDTINLGQPATQKLEEELKAFHSLVGSAADELIRVAQSTLKTKTLKLTMGNEIDRLEQEGVNLSIDMEYVNEAQTETNRKLSKLRRKFAGIGEQLQKEEIDLQHRRGAIAVDLFLALKTLWKSSCVNLEETMKLRSMLLEKNARISNLLSTEMAMAASGDGLKKEMKALQSHVLEIEIGNKKALEKIETQKRDLDKGYYDNVQKLVDARVGDEKTRLSERLAEAHVAVKQRDKLTLKIEELQPKIADLEREMERSSVAKAGLETKYTHLKFEADVVKEGYDQLTKHNAELQMEISDLRGDVVRLTEERDNLLAERASAQNTRNTSQAMVHPPAALAITSTPTSRYQNEHEHLSGLIGVWQNTLDTVISDLSKTHAEKDALDSKIQDIERQLQEVKPTRKSAPPTGAKVKSNSLDVGLGSSTKKGRPLVSKEVLPSTAQSGIFAARMSRVSAGPFPALGAPAAPTLKSFAEAAAGKVLRVVEVPKADKGKRPRPSAIEALASENSEHTEG